MFRIKRLYTFILTTFSPLLLATYSICLFVLLMQFLWMYVSDMVGKGVGIGVLGQLFFYASLSFTPMALPLAVLLASLMTFGNLGEHFELTAMKASGVSLLRIMKPLIGLVFVLAGISFVFQNNILPQAQIKMYTIVLSLKQKSPELDIPEGIFYKEITGYNVYVRHKDLKTGFLHDMMIYDYSKGFENAAVIVADSGKISASTDKQYLILSLYKGESFENLETRKTRNVDEKIPYRRETFDLRRILIPFDTNFNLADESIMGSRDINKNLYELTAFIDSVRLEQDSVNAGRADYFKQTAYAGTFRTEKNHPHSSANKSISAKDSLFAQGFEVYYDSLSLDKRISYLQQAKTRADQVQNDYLFIKDRQEDILTQLRSHEVQRHKRFSLALSCILFFFIGAPLGAIVRKGGLGMPVVLSVFIFLLYYVTDVFGMKLSKEGVWDVISGSWISTLVLVALGAFFTYKAVNDSVMMNPDAWRVFFQRFIRKK